ncbi:UNVERIFIED_CONTAM: protein transport protein SEC16A [Sesamum radiatum]|uniref:Protein transport protein sec16 n=1 Tax=Sesamum radiatum TaxID=300843 RepID=A0AAW2TXY8_SESRA
MASGPPPFQVEDTTDEDFFDKLVNDDDDVDFKDTTTSSTSVPLFSSNGNESDKVKAFANLRIDEIDNNCDVSCDKAGTSNHIGIDNCSTEIEKVEQINKLGDPGESGNPSMLSNYLEFESLIHQLENEDGGAEVLSDTTVVSKSSGEGFSDMTAVSKISGELGAPGVKEVGWSAFHADSTKGDGNGFGSYSDFFTELGGEKSDDAFGEVVGHIINNGPDISIGNDIHRSTYMENFNSFWQYNEGYNNDVAADQSSDAHDLNSSHYWENQYPGWKYDLSTGQWYQVDGYDVSSSMQANLGSDLSSTWGLANELAEVSYLQQTSKSVPGTTTESVTNWNQTLEESSGTAPASSNLNQVSQDNNDYPPHMVFDPQYPGWYYDIVVQEWCTLESYTALVQSTPQVQEEMHGGGYASTDTFYEKDDEKTYHTNDQSNSYSTQGFGSQVQDQNWTQSASNYDPQGSTMWQPQNVARRESTPQYIGNQLSEDHHRHNFTVSPHECELNTINYGVKASYYENARQGQNEFTLSSGLLGFPGGNLIQQYNDSQINQNDEKHILNDYYNNQNPIDFSKQQIQSAQISYTPTAGRSSAGRPAHALVAFGFGGKLIVLKDSSSTENFNFGGQNHVGGSISILNLAEVVNHYCNSSNNVIGVYNYFQALCQQFVPGPLSSGSIGTRELNKWIDERIANPADMDYRKDEVLKMLLSLLKIACQHYGKLRSPYGTDNILKENDSPESAVAKLFASTKRNGLQFSQYGIFTKCLQQMPSEEQMQVTAIEVQSLLVSGRKKEALQCAQEGQLWGVALVLAAQLGDQFYVETVKQMALHQFVAGSPLRTICLLIAGQPADVFSANNTTISSMFGTNGMLDDWEENLAVITANRTKDDELVLMHLGDCLWKERSDIIAAHICYLVAEASFEPYSDAARMCLVGADHWKYPRTYASPEAIQRTEIYEYSKTLGNSQFVLLSFQPYKLIYAYMLAEVGRISDALKYCQAIIKSLKTGRTTEVDTLRHLVSSLEERIKAHQQGGFSTNLAPKKLVGKLLNLFDTTAHRVVGSIPPAVSVASGNAQVNENYQSLGPRVPTSQSTLAMSSLVPSQSSEPISDRTTNSNRMVMHTRSVSEPNFGRSPMQGHTDSLKEESSTNVEDKASTAGGLVLRPRQGRQAKLGESNKFYYDEKLKRWVEEGVEPPAKEATHPPPPPTTISHTNRSPEFKSPKSVENSSGIPPLPPTSNQYSTRGRMGVRSRYVDTFNKGGQNATNLFQSPSTPSVKPATGANPKFFVPTPVAVVDHPVDASVNNMHGTLTHENHATSTLSDSFHSPTHQSSATMQRFASMTDISNQGMSNNGSSSAHSRRTVSWSGSFNDSFSDPNSADIKPLGEVLGMHPSQFMPSHHSGARSSVRGGGDDLPELEL